MIVAVASGKGGTGKTTIATSLALSLAGIHETAPLFLDCDVEAPDAHLFLSPSFSSQEKVGILIPEIDEKKCTKCGTCVDACQFNALAILGERVIVFPELCHGCGSCSSLCPEKAICEKPNHIGILESGVARDGITFSHGYLNIGEPMAVPIIRQLKSSNKGKHNQYTIIDCPPGTSCPVVASVQGVDFLLLVTEPTPFGLHDLRLAVQLARQLHLPAGVIINKEQGSYQETEDYCKTEGIPIMMRIPFKRNIAEGIARGINLIDIVPEYRQDFTRLLKFTEYVSGESS